MTTNGQHHAAARENDALWTVDAMRVRVDALLAERIAMLKGLAKNEGKLLELGLALSKAGAPEFCPTCGHVALHAAAPHDGERKGEPMLVLRRCPLDHTWRRPVVAEPEPALPETT